MSLKKKASSSPLLPSCTETDVTNDRLQYSQTLDLMRASSGALNFHDTLIALSCQERGIPAIASFDPDFDQACTEQSRSVAWLRRLERPEDVPSASP